MENAKDIKKYIMDKCSILYCMKDKPMTLTCMYWGLEIGDGWLNVVDLMSCKLEALNLVYYPKFKVRILMDQVKEKFGTLCAYFSVHCDDVEMSNEQEVIMSALNSCAEEIVRWAEDECYKTCEKCGVLIGTKWSPRCLTAGWITYLCDKCAAKTNSFYYKNRAKWHGDKMIMSKEEVEEKRKKNKCNEDTL